MALRDADVLMKSMVRQRWHFSLGTVRQWHWISSALCLVGMLLFAVTGITLNHAADIPSQHRVTLVETDVPDQLMDPWLADGEPRSVLPEELRDWLHREHGVVVRSGLAGEWQHGEFYLPLPRPGGDAWLSIDGETGELIYEHTDRGWIAWLNDLHKGRNTGVAWSWFIDIFAVACVVFCVSGLLLLQRHAGSRPSTWPLTTLGLVIPLLLILIFIH